MRLPRLTDKALLILTIFILSFVFAFSANHNNHDTFAENENGVYEETVSHFVTFYDEGQKLIIKTDAKTVGEAIEGLKLVLNETDIVEPGLDTEINANNFFVNIYRSRPVVMKDGAVSRYIMTASYDLKTVAREAGMTIYDGDEIKMVTNANFLEAGAATTYEIIRNGGRIVTVEEEIPFVEQTVKDYNLAPGQREVRQYGEVGVKELSFEVFYENNFQSRPKGRNSHKGRA